MFNYLRSYLEYLEAERGYSSHTVLAYQNDLTQFLKFLERKKIASLDKVKKGTLRLYLGSCLEQGFTKKSIARKVASLRSFYKFLHRRKVLLTNPTLTLLSPRVERHLPTYLDETTMMRAVEAPESTDKDGLRDSAILELFYSTGIRLSELVGLNINDVDFERKTLKVHGKGNKERIIPIGRKASDALRRYLTATEKERSSASDKRRPLFLSRRGERIYPVAVGRIVKKYLDRVSEVEKKSPHVIRHSFATHLLNRGADLAAVKELLGHESLSTTQIYTHVSTERMKKVYRQSHPKAE